MAATVADRTQGIDALLRTGNLCALVANSYESLRYFAGTDIYSQTILPDRLAFFLAVHDEPESLLVCSIEESHARTQDKIRDIRTYVEFRDDPATAVVDLLRSRGITTGRVGIEGRRLSAVVLRTLESRIPDVQFVAVDNELEMLQTVKTQGEIELLGHGAEVLLAALARVTLRLPRGSTELEYAREIGLEVNRAGGHLIFLFFASGPNTTLLHPIAQNEGLSDGTIWRTDLCASFAGGLKADVARTGVVGTPTAEQEEIFEIVRETQDAIVQLIEPDRPARELYEVARRKLAHAKLPFDMPHVGHGIGIGLHEAPMLEPANMMRLVPGMVLNIEPLIKLESRNETYHTEDAVLVTETGHDRLTTPQNELLRVFTG